MTDSKDIIEADRRSGDLERRATASYYRTATTGMGSIIQPGACEVVEHEGLHYVRMTNINGTLAMYRVRVVGGKTVLKGLKRWPKELD